MGAGIGTSKLLLWVMGVLYAIIFTIGTGLVSYTFQHNSAIASLVTKVQDEAKRNDEFEDRIKEIEKKANQALYRSH